MPRAAPLAPAVPVPSTRVASLSGAVDHPKPATVPLLLWSSEGAIAQPPSATTIPALFWTYWNDEALPLVVRACLNSWRAHHPDARITVLHPDTLPEGIPTSPPGFGEWTPQQQSDWVRLAVLAHFGGVWMDATTVLHAPLHFIAGLTTRHRPDLIGYFNRERTHDAVFPMLENWFLAAPRNSRFVHRWWRTFDGLLQADGSADVTPLLSDALTLKALLQGFSHAPDYFACHAAAQYVLREALGTGGDSEAAVHIDGRVDADLADRTVRTDLVDRTDRTDSTNRAAYRLALMPAELDAFFEVHSRHWEPDRVGAWLCEAAEHAHALPQRPQARLTKLIGLLWRPLEARMQRGDVHPASIMGRLLR